MDFDEAKDLGVNLVSLGNKKVLSMSGGVNLNKARQDLGDEVITPDMSIYTLGGIKVRYIVCVRY
ncbi:MAG: hypothetical protein ACI9FD_002757 [Gammaproteobacteria bacterium]